MDISKIKINKRHFPGDNILFSLIRSKEFRLSANDYGRQYSLLHLSFKMYLLRGIRKLIHLDDYIFQSIVVHDTIF